LREQPPGEVSKQPPEDACQDGEEEAHSSVGVSTGSGSAADASSTCSTGCT
jgi:hypothetical protein